jgi:hypothetical protein
MWAWSNGMRAFAGWNRPHQSWWTTLPTFPTSRFDQCAYFFSHALNHNVWQDELTIFLFAESPEGRWSHQLAHREICYQSLPLWSTVLLATSWSTRHMPPGTLRWALSAGCHGLYLPEEILPLKTPSNGFLLWCSFWCWWQWCIFFVVSRCDEEVCTNPSVDELMLHHEKLSVDSWCNNLIHC